MKSNKAILLGILLSIATYLGADALTFTKAYQLALANANSIQSSSYLAQSDKEKIEQERSQLYPQINFSGSYKNANYKYDDVYVESRPGVTPDIKQSLFNGSISLKQSIYTPETYSRIDLQESRSDYSELKVEIEKEELAKNVFNAYLDLLKSRSKIALLESYLRFNKIKYTKIEKQFQKNLSNKMDLLEMKVEFDSAKIDLHREQKLFNAYSLKLQQYIGNAEYQLPSIKGSDQPIVDMITSMQAIVKGETKSLKIKQAKIAAQISQKNIDNAFDAHLPKVTLDAAFSAYKSLTNDIDILTPYKHTEYAMININLPIYSGGYTSSRVTSSKLEYKAALEEIEKVKKDVDTQYAHFLAIFDASVESVTMYRDSLASTELYVDSVEKGYQHGLKNIIDLNEAKSKYYEIKYKYVENIYEMVDSYISLLMITHNFQGVKLLDELVKN